MVGYFEPFSFRPSSPEICRDQPGKTSPFRPSSYLGRVNLPPSKAGVCKIEILSVSLEVVLSTFEPYKKATAETAHKN